MAGFLLDPDQDVPPPPDLPLAENPIWPAENSFLRAFGIAPESMFSFKVKVKVKVGAELNRFRFPRHE